MYLFQKKLSAAFTAFVCLIFILSACKSVDPEKEKLAKELEKAEKERRDQWFQDTDGKKIAPERDMVEEMLKSSPFKSRKILIPSIRQKIRKTTRHCLQICQSRM